MDDFAVTGAHDLERLARRLKEQGGSELRKKLLKGIRETNKPTINAIREEARSTLPHRGGLADLVARSSIGTRTRTSGDNVGVEIRGTGKQVRSLRDLNAGKLRHPVYGNRNNWVEQQIEPGWFDRPIEADLPRIHRALTDVMQDIGRDITRGI